jgi:hypothetical protein
VSPRSNDVVERLEGGVRLAEEAVGRPFRFALNTGTWRSTGWSDGGTAALDALFWGAPAPTVGLLLDFHLEHEGRAVARRLRDPAPQFFRSAAARSSWRPACTTPRASRARSRSCACRSPTARSAPRCCGECFLRARCRTRRRCTRPFPGRRRPSPEAQRGPSSAPSTTTRRWARPRYRAVIQEKQRLLLRDRGPELVEARASLAELGGSGRSAWDGKVAGGRAR